MDDDSIYIPGETYDDPVLGQINEKVCKYCKSPENPLIRRDEDKHLSNCPVLVNRITQLLTALGLNDDEQKHWLLTPVKALSPTYAEDTTPQSLINAGKAYIVVALLDELSGGTWSL
jgi:hypothetical protein